MVNPLPDHRSEFFSLASPAGGKIGKRLTGQRQTGWNHGPDIHGLIAEDTWPVQYVIDCQRGG
jgi:hypothetical protein